MILSSDSIKNMSKAIWERYLPLIKHDVYMADRGENIYTIDTILDYLRGLEKGHDIRYIDKETLLVCLGLLMGQGKLSISKAHGRGQGFFYTITVKRDKQ